MPRTLVFDFSFSTISFAILLAACAAPTPTPGAVVEGMVYIPGGEFTMGSDVPAVCRLCPGDQEAVAPARTVRTASYWMDLYEVTNAQYRECVGAKQCQPPSQIPRGLEEYYTDSKYEKYP
ncbi:MAG: SUMF1/EgtB/PvdO family nonheme iron enzyme, partial [Chloroflexi bacterium]|nr:SUMF1/EgtB/PvdO family nonheme iron enzyme [Chloroflexota bacterium]